MTAQDALKVISQGQSLSFQDAETVMSILMLGEVPDGLVGGLLVAFQMKGVSGEELAGFASSMRFMARKLGHTFPDVIDTCGTGGGIPTFNISTGAALVAAAAGAKVAKHGNRSQTGQGSADILELLGVKFADDPGRLTRCLEDIGIAFLYAPSHHSSMRHVAGVRRALGMRTIFNLLGPISNPAGARRQLIGIQEQRHMSPVSDALQRLGSEHCLVVHGVEGLDEVSPCGETLYIETKSDSVTHGVWTPADFGMDPVDPSALLAGKTLAESKDILVEALTDAKSARAKVLLPSASAALVLAGICSDFKEGAHLASSAIASGAASAKLAELVREMSEEA